MVPACITEKKSVLACIAEKKSVPACITKKNAGPGRFCGEGPSPWLGGRRRRSGPVRV